MEIGNRVWIPLICLAAIIGSCSEDIQLIPSAEEALAGEWHLTEGIYTWSNNTRVSPVVQAVDTTPSISLIFTSDQQFLLLYTFFILRDSIDTLTISSGVEQGIFDLSVTESKAQASLFCFDGGVSIQKGSSSPSASGINYCTGTATDTLKLDQLKLSNLLFGTVDGVFIRQ